MSLAYRNRKKEEKRARSAEERSLSARLRKGIMPKLFFSRDRNGELERAPKVVGSGFRAKVKQALTWRIESTFAALTKGDKK